MQPLLHYPDLLPPPGWTWQRQGSHMALLPPADAPPATILLSPLLARHERLPAPERLIEMALALEEEIRFAVTDRGPFHPVEADTGLRGVYLEVGGYVRPASTPERRIYVVYVDQVCYYGINYLAPAGSFAVHQAAFWAAARSVRPVPAAALVPPQPPAASCPVGHYED
ncbi:MAG: hypothetical protein NZ890_14010 [Myxococcota bacterium]|nr:hypothetical protein [Myxococcota bacterium]